MIPLIFGCTQIAPPMLKLQRVYSDASAIVAADEDEDDGKCSDDDVHHQFSASSSRKRPSTPLLKPAFSDAVGSLSTSMQMSARSKKSGPSLASQLPDLDDWATAAGTALRDPEDGSSSAPLQGASGVCWTRAQLRQVNLLSLIK